MSPIRYKSSSPSFLVPVIYARCTRFFQEAEQYIRFAMDFWILVSLLVLNAFVQFKDCALITCERTYKKEGCFKGTASLTTELVNYQATNNIDWNNFGASLHSLACECSAKAKKKNWKYFGIHHYGVCFGGAEFSAKTAERSTHCCGPSFGACSGDAQDCSGSGDSIFVFNTGPETAPTAPPGICGKKLDIVIALDSSSSLYYSDWENEKQFVKLFVNSTLIGPLNVKLSIISFSTTAQVEIKFNDYSNAKELKKKLAHVYYRGGFTRTDLALKMTKEVLFHSAFGARQDAKKILIILTDGETLGKDAKVNWKQELVTPARELKDSGVTVFAAGIGNDVSQSELQTIASSPSNDYILNIGDFRSLKGSGRRFAEMACGGKFSNVAIRKPTVQSSTFSNYFGASSHAVDGNSNNQYYGMSCTRTEEEQNPWWRVDLQKETEVFEVKVVNRGDCCGSRLNGFEIRVGNSLEKNGNGNTICADQLPIYNAQTKTFVCKQPIKGRYVNIRIPEYRRTLTLCEVEVIAKVNET